MHPQRGRLNNTGASPQDHRPQDTASPRLTYLSAPQTEVAPKTLTVGEEVPKVGSSASSKRQRLESSHFLRKPWGKRGTPLALGGRVSLDVHTAPETLPGPQPAKPRPCRGGQRLLLPLIPIPMPAFGLLRPSSGCKKGSGPQSLGSRSFVTAPGRGRTPRANVPLGVGEAWDRSRVWGEGAHPLRPDGARGPRRLPNPEPKALGTRTSGRKGALTIEAAARRSPSALRLGPPRPP